MKSTRKCQDIFLNNFLVFGALQPPRGAEVPSLRCDKHGDIAPWLQLPSRREILSIRMMDVKIVFVFFVSFSKNLSVMPPDCRLTEGNSESLREQAKATKVYQKRKLNLFSSLPPVKTPCNAPAL